MITTLEAVSQLKIAQPQAVIAEVDFLGQVTIDINNDALKDVLSYLKVPVYPGYEVLMDLTGIDYLFPEMHTKIIYMLHNPTNYERLVVRVSVKRGEALPSITGLWEGADWYERELYDMFGVHFENHPDMKRILMPDDWRGHPMRRDYPLTEVPVQFKYGVKPKIPSEIIPHVQCKKKNQ